MSNRSRRGPASRAEARRRARQIERSEDLPNEEVATDEATARPRPGGLLERLFPPAPPLPNRPDPLAGFHYEGPLRSVVAAGYLLANHPRAWLLPAIPWATAQSVAHLPITPSTYAPVQIPATLINVFTLMAAGWIGWQRPWLFGLATAVAGTVLEALFLTLLYAQLPRADFSPAGSFLGWIVFEIAQLQWLLAAFIGWYGGYLRRRMAVPSAQSRGRPGGRRR